MKASVGTINAAGLLVALSLSVGSGVRVSTRGDEVPARTATEHDPFPIREARGAVEIADASGVWIELTRFERIVSASTIADELLLEFCEPNRIVAFTAFSQRNDATKHRYAGKPQIAALDDLETLIALEPDLVLANTLGAEKRIARLRERGIRVFDLGEMRGLESFLANARVIAALVGHADLGRRYADTFRQRMERVAGEVPDGERLNAAYVSVFGTSIHGGGRRTSYHDVLRYAGLENLLAKRHEGWPDLSAEELLELDPEVILTFTGMGRTLCSSSVLDRLSACRENRRSIIEVEPNLLSDPGAAMLPATEAVRRRTLELKDGKRR